MRASRIIRGGDDSGKMIPDIDPGLIENSGEQRFYEAVAGLLAAHTAYYSYKFSAGEYALRQIPLSRPKELYLFLNAKSTGQMKRRQRILDQKYGNTGFMFVVNCFKCRQ